MYMPVVSYLKNTHIHCIKTHKSDPPRGISVPPVLCGDWLGGKLRRRDENQIPHDSYHLLRVCLPCDETELRGKWL